MRSPHRLIGVVGCLLAALGSHAQTAGSKREIVMPNPQLIHCHSAGCSQLWKQNPASGGAVYPAQIMTDFVNGEVVGLTAVYDKSVSASELRAAIEALYGGSTFHGVAISTWRVESHRFSISMFDGADGAQKVTYLELGTPSSLVPSAHIYSEKDCR
jgi:hypothetical protein